MKLFAFIVVLFFGFVATAQTVDDFVVEVSSSHSPQFLVTASGTVNIDWGDGLSTTLTNPSNRSVGHNYSSSGSLPDRYTIIMSGSLSFIDMGCNLGNTNGIIIRQWGNSQWQSTSGMFKDCINLSILTTDIPDFSQLTDMSHMFENTYNFNSDISNWDVSNVTNMSYMFAKTSSNSVISIFNQPLNNWDVSNVTTMDFMFSGRVSFNQPLNNWNVANVTSMKRMFSGVYFAVRDPGFKTNFNQPLDNWNVSNVLNMDGIFGRCSFNRDVSSWDFNTAINFDGFPETFASLGTSNYDLLIRRFVELNLRDKFFGIESGSYCDAFSRNILVQRGWTFYYDSQSSTCSNNNIRGTILYDTDNNGCDASDLLINNLSVEISDGTNSFNVYTTNGQYSLNLPDGTYSLTPQPNTSFFSIAPSITTITVANAASVVEDFCITATTPTDDLEVTILPLQDARPGFYTNYKLIYKNKGNTQLSGSVDFTYEDDFMDFLSSNPATTSSSTGMLSWDFIDLDPFETREIEFTMNLNTPTDSTFPLNSNDLLDFSATINPTANDDTPLDNVFDLQQTVVNSYDPNDKTCLQGETILPSMVGEYVHYRIRFENEGTASAVNVRIVDYIDTSKFDITTLTPLSVSHDYITTITEGNKVEFLFDDIMLPFTAPASQGYVLFKIKTVDTLVLGDDFTNQAEIYFDFNFPIITNLETTEVAVPLSLNDNNLLEVSLYPNPAQNTINVTSNLKFNEYIIYDTLGGVVSQEKLEVSTLNKDILVNHLVSGLYFVEVKGGQMSSVLKLIKE